jgi:Kelch motif/Galactose oxidase, central domain
MATQWHATLTIGIAAGLLGGCSVDGGPTPSNALILAPVDGAPSSPARQAGESVQAVRKHLARSIAITPDPQADITKIDVFGAATPRITPKPEAFLPEGFGEATGAPNRTARVSLPKRANGVFRVTDDASGLDVAVKLKGARDVAGEDVSGIVAYPAAYEGNADVLHRPTPHGTEDYLYFPTTLPKESSVRYEVALGEGVHGLRLVNNQLEMLDAAGAPRLRMAEPYAIAADGRYVSLDVALEGCEYSTDKRLPYGRPLVAPGARTCDLRIDWSNRGLVAPLLVDPGWASTKPTTKARSQHTATLLKDGRVLVAGGTSAGYSAEVYDPGTVTWTFSANSLTTPRYAHTATLLENGTVLVVGGKNINLSAATKDVESYDPATNMWTPMPNSFMAEARMLHTATRLSDGRVLVIGGDRFPVTEPSSTAEIFNPTTGAWSPAGSLTTPREVHTATLLKDDHVLVVGGTAVPFNVNMQPAPVPYKTTKIWNPNINDFEDGPDTIKPHVGHIAEALGGERVLIAGGSFSTAAEVYDSALNTWKQAGSMAVGRILFASAPLPGGRVLVMGSYGDNINASQGSEVCPQVLW